MIMEKVCIFIDGANFHHLVLKKLNIPELNFDFDKFAYFLANGREISEDGKRFYVGTVREKEGNTRSKQAMSKQTALFSILKGAKWEVKTSKLRTRIERIKVDDRVKNYQQLLSLGIKEIEVEATCEKGVDVKLATDLIVFAVDNKYDTTIVVNSDTDLIPAMDWVRSRYKKKIEYIGFSIISKNPKQESTKPLSSMIVRSDIQRTLIESDLNKFIQKALF